MKVKIDSRVGEIELLLGSDCFWWLDAIQWGIEAEP